MPANHYINGAWNVICDSCGFKKKNFEVRKRWDGLIVCADTCWETDHPQKYIKVKEGPIAPPFVRPDPVPSYLDVCYVFESQSYSGISSSGCWRSGINSTPYATLLAWKTASLG